MASSAAEPRNPAELPQRQLDCLYGVWCGRQAGEIAATLALSPRTVESHLQQARRALGASSSLEAARLAAEALSWQTDRIRYGPQRIRLPVDGAPVPCSAPPGGRPATDLDLGPRSTLRVVVGMLKVAGKVALYAGGLLAGLLLLLNALQATVGRVRPHGDTPIQGARGARSDK